MRSRASLLNPSSLWPWVKAEKRAWSGHEVNEDGQECELDVVRAQ